MKPRMNPIINVICSLFISEFPLVQEKFQRVLLFIDGFCVPNKPVVLNNAFAPRIEVTLLTF